MTKSVDVGTKRPEEIKALLADDKPILMLYRMQMCPHCIALQSTWTDVKKRLSRDTGVVVAEVEYQHMSLLPASLRNIRGFPTLQIIQKGRVKDEYTGDRTLESIVTFARTHKPKPVKASASKTTGTKKTAASA